jgi:hypothetical protein
MARARREAPSQMNEIPAGAHRDRDEHDAVVPGHVEEVGVPQGAGRAVVAGY